MTLEINKLYLGDCRELLKDIDDNSVNLIIADIPYNIGKDTWDKMKPNEYMKLITEAFKECERVLADNGSFYFFHNDIRQMGKIDNWLEDNTGFIFKQMIVWNKRFDGSGKKGFLDGYCEVEMLKNYQQMAEYIFFYTFQDETGAERMSSIYYEINPFAKYLTAEFKNAGISNKQIAKLFPSKTGGMTGCVSNWLLGYNTPTKEQYLKIRDWLNQDDSNKYLRKEYEDLRYTFNNQKTHHSVWNYEIAPQMGHLTPKPINLIKNIILHSSNPGDLILDPFLGSGTTAVAAKELGRNFIGMELEQKYIDIAQNRLDGVNEDLFIKITD